MMSNKIRNILILSTILLCGVLLRLQGLFHTLEYDEIWTLQTFLDQSLRRIFSDFDLPNNHPLNTIAVCLAYFGKECAWTIRLGAFLASLGTIIAGYFLGQRIAGRQTGFLTALALAILPAFAAQGYTARGYSGQLLLLLLTTLFLLKSRKSYLWSTLALISGILAAISLPTSVLWLFPLGIIILLRAIKKKNFRDRRLYIISITGIFNAAWLLYHFGSYRKGTAFQIPLTTAYEYVEYFFKIFSSCGFPLYILLLCTALQFRRKLLWSLLFTALFAPLATLFTAPGPSRVYLPGSAAGILLAATAIPQLTRRLKQYRKIGAYLLFTGLLIPAYIISSNRLQREPDWKEVGRFVSQLPQAVLPCFTAVNGFPAQWNHPDFTGEFINRLQYASRLPRCILLTCGENISGIGIKGDTVSRQLPANAKKVEDDTATYYTVELQQSDRLMPGESGFIMLPVQPTEQLNRHVKYMLQNGNTLIMLNSFLTTPLQIPGRSEPYRYRLFAVTANMEVKSSPGIKIFIPAP